MTGDYRLFIKLHNGFPEHPKTVGLSDRAFRNLIELWCYCSRNLTDGKVRAATASKFLSSRSCAELLAAGYLAEAPDGYTMTGYLEHQMSAAQVAELRERRSEAGRRGGKAKASARANAKQEPKQKASKPVADIDVDKDKYLRNVGDQQSEPRSKPVRIESANLARIYTSKVKLANFGNVATVVQMALAANYTPEQIGQALEALANTGRSVTENTLRIEIEGKPGELKTGTDGITRRDDGTPVAGRFWTEY